MGATQDAITSGIFRRAMRVDRIKPFPGTKKIGIVIRTSSMEHETIKYLLELAERHNGKFSITNDRTGRQLFSAMIVVEDDPKAQVNVKKPTDSASPPPNPCPECARIHRRFASGKVVRLESQIPELVRFKSESSPDAEFYLHLYCAETLQLLSK